MIISYRDIGSLCPGFLLLLSKQNYKIDRDVTSKKMTTVSRTASTVTQTISPAADHLEMGSLASEGSIGVVRTETSLNLRM